MSLVLKWIIGNQQESFSTKGKAIGDSTIATGSGKDKGVNELIFTINELNKGYVCYTQALPGNTIGDQLNIWSNDPSKLLYDWVIIQVGLNDMMPNDAQGIIDNYQNLVNVVKSTSKESCKVIVSCMLPCKQRWIDLGWIYGQQNWEALNNAIMTTIANVDGRINQHVAILDDGEGNLKSIYDTGDHIHENLAGAQVIADAWREKLIELELIK